MRKSQYSLWLIPTGDVYKRLANLIRQLSRQYTSPSFEPHVTLIGGMVGSKEEILSKTARLTNFLKPHSISLANVRYLDEFFRCLFISVKETDDVMKANLRAREVFDHIQDQKYMPHLSLMYGDFPSELKEKIIAKIGKEFKMNFEVEIISLFLTAGRAENWRLVKNFPLK